MWVVWWLCTGRWVYFKSIHAGAFVRWQFVEFLKTCNIMYTWYITYYRPRENNMEVFWNHLYYKEEMSKEQPALYLVELFSFNFLSRLSTVFLCLFSTYTMHSYLHVEVLESIYIVCDWDTCHILACFRAKCISVSLELYTALVPMPWVAAEWTEIGGLVSIMDQPVIWSAKGNPRRYSFH